MAFELSITTFNVLAPEYKRLPRKREKDKPSLWRKRHRGIIEFLTDIGSSIMCLQEFWFDAEFVSMYENAFSDRYHIVKSRRPYKADGICVFIAKELFEIVGYDTLYFKVGGQRIAVLLHLRLKDVPGSDFFLASTHLTFPHSFYDRRQQTQQMQEIISTLTDAISHVNLDRIPVFLCGDMNSEMTNEPCRLALEHGFSSSSESCYHMSSDSSEEWKPITHLTHKGVSTHADYIFYKIYDNMNPAPISPTPDSPTFDKKRKKSSSYFRKVLRFSRKKKKVSESKSDEEEPLKSAILGLELLDSLTLPEGLSDQEWPRENVYSLSDHRPVKGTFTLLLDPSYTDSGVDSGDGDYEIKGPED